MAAQFPDPTVTTTYINPTTKEEYEWNSTTMGWRRVSGSGSSGEFVEKAGDTMTGPLVQSPGRSTDAVESGDLATNTPTDKSLEFKLMGGDGTVRCVTLPLDCCQTVTQRTYIQISGGGSGFAEVGDVLQITANATISPPAAIDSTQWQRETGAGTLVFEDIAGQIAQSYTVDAADLGLRIRVRETFLLNEECEKVVPSNVIAIMSASPPKSDYVGVSFTEGVLKMQMTLTADAEVYRQDGENWTLVDTLTAGTGVRFTTSDSGLYAVESVNMTALRFSYSSNDSSSRRIGLSLDQDRSYLGAITDASYMFAYHMDFNQDLSGWDTSNVTNMSYMFYAPNGIFNQDIGNWNTSNVTDMSYMFSGAAQFNQDISSWNTSNVTDMNNMLYKTTVFNQDISTKEVTVGANTYTAWDTSNVTDMNNMLYKAVVFEQDISNWNTSNVTDMSYLFSFANVFNQDISGWNTGNAVNMNYMFYGAAKFNQDISTWCVGLIPSKPTKFDEKTPVGFENNDEVQPQWNTCPSPLPKIDSLPIIE